MRTNNTYDMNDIYENKHSKLDTDTYSEPKSCTGCIWQDQCGNEGRCENYDSGSNEVYGGIDDILDEIIEAGREKFKDEWQEYVMGWED